MHLLSLLSLYIIHNLLVLYKLLNGFLFYSHLSEMNASHFFGGVKTVMELAGMHNDIYALGKHCAHLTHSTCDTNACYYCKIKCASLHEVQASMSVYPFYTGWALRCLYAAQQSTNETAETQIQPKN